MKRIAAVLVAMTLVTACGGDDDSEQATGQSERAQHNEADVEFTQGMIPHHEQAVEMAKLAPTRAQSPEVKDLATQIEAAQAPEIDTMTEWLESWGEELPQEMEHGSGGGMMSEDQMSQLEAATGPQFDRLFLEQMTEHHRGAIEMAEQELEDGQYADALALARTIRDTQQREIATMEGLLARVG